MYIGNGRPWEVDHVLPMQYGGAVRDVQNLALACNPCNAMKSATRIDVLQSELEQVVRAEGQSAVAEQAARMLAYRNRWPDTWEWVTE